MSGTADTHCVVVGTNQNLAETHYITAQHIKTYDFNFMSWQSPPYLHSITVYPIFEDIRKELAENEAKYKCISKNGKKATCLDV